MKYICKDKIFQPIFCKNRVLFEAGKNKKRFYGYLRREGRNKDKKKFFMNLIVILEIFFF
jgi:hypothetical protein